MIFNKHSDLEGQHAFLSPSQFSWLNYSDEKLAARFVTIMAAKRGSDLHALAHEAIRLGVKVDKRAYPALANYVKDAIAYRMSCEQPLVYSSNCFGTPDTISFRRSVLRIHDLKTGVSRASEKQLEIYAALFCLEYSVDPFSIEINLRIYQNDEPDVYEPNPHRIVSIMEKIVEFDAQIERLKASEDF